MPPTTPRPARLPSVREEPSEVPSIHSIDISDSDFENDTEDGQCLYIAYKACEMAQKLSEHAASEARTVKPQDPTHVTAPSDEATHKVHAIQNQTKILRRDLSKLSIYFSRRAGHTKALAKGPEEIVSHVQRRWNETSNTDQSFMNVLRDSFTELEKLGHGGASEDPTWRLKYFAQRIDPALHKKLGGRDEDERKQSEAAIRHTLDRTTPGYYKGHVLQSGPDWKSTFDTASFWLRPAYGSALNIKTHRLPTAIGPNPASASSSCTVRADERSDLLLYVAAINARARERWGPDSCVEEVRDQWAAPAESIRGFGTSAAKRRAELESTRECFGWTARFAVLHAGSDCDLTEELLDQAAATTSFIDDPREPVDQAIIARVSKSMRTLLDSASASQGRSPVALGFESISETDRILRSIAKESRDEIMDVLGPRPWPSLMDDNPTHETARRWLRNTISKIDYDPNILLPPSSAWGNSIDTVAAHIKSINRAYFESGK